MTITEPQAPAPTAGRHHCPPWCETLSHDQGELDHLATETVFCSLHPVEAPTVEAARHSRQPGLRTWHEQHLSVSVTLVHPPAAAEPFLILEAGDDPSRLPGHEPPLQTRLTLAEAGALAEAMQRFVNSGRWP